MAKTDQKWYASWFDSEYYHILYKDRDRQEAEEFMGNLVAKLGLKHGAEILDLACGKGRHSVYLNQLGYSVTGVDLSENSIFEAKKNERDGLAFYVHDMCQAFPKKFDAVLNLFTSFGYFKNNENLKTLEAIKQELKPGGVGVIDFLNVNHVRDFLIPRETKLVKGITFHLERQFKDGHITKQIDFKADGEWHSFSEKVQALSLADFKTYFDKTGLDLLHTFGDYQLSDYDEASSERLIIVFQ